MRGQPNKLLASDNRVCHALCCRTSCGMPMPDAKDHGGGDMSNLYCVYCTDETGKLKSRAEIREGMINLYMSRMGKPREDAEKFVDEQMKKLPAWRE